MTDGHSMDEPREIGPYKLISVLGEGGMGVVYLAEQTDPIRRRVALKVMKPGMDTRQVIARFESERQALAVMDHPNIARVLDGGVTPEGRPYFVMELVHGTPITSYADTHRLSVEQRLRLFLDVCAAVQHAHHKGVIHRDLKPTNVLVSVHDSGPVVKVIDFGIAKAVGLGLTDRTLVTHVGQILGTPEYMSPEQAEMTGLDVDTRTDIYSLGVMLYELLVGVLPFDLGAKPDYVITHALRERDIPRPSTRLTSLGDTLPTVARYRATSADALRREIRGDLDWIILKAMEKDRTRRYETARGLANDIRRHLDNVPVVARPPSARYVLGKFVRRNRVAVLAGSVAVAAVLLGTAGAAVGLVHAREQQRRAEQSATLAEQVIDFMTGLFRISNPGDAQGRTVTVREVLDTGAERIQTDLAGQPVVQARLMRTIGEVYTNLGLYDDASTMLRRSVATLERTGDNAADLVVALNRLGGLYRMQGRMDEAEATLLRAVALARAHEEDGGLRASETLGSLANVYHEVGRFDEAESRYLEALAIQERLLPPDDRRLGATVGNLAAMYLNQRRLDQAEPLLRRSVRINQANFGPDHLEVALDYNNLGASYYLRGRLEEAADAYGRADEIMTRVLEPNHPLVAGIQHNLGEIDWRLGRYAEARARLERSLAIKEQLLGTEHASVARTLKALGNLAEDDGRPADAERYYRRALTIFDRVLDLPDANVRETLEGLARLLHATGRPDEASALEARAAAITTRD
jgi:eukaryotic-like serine/threonine-protein kinase